MINTRLLEAGNPEGIERAVALLREGKLVAFPTDTVYGLGTAALAGDSVGRLYVAKGRPSDKAIPILVASLEEARDLVVDVTPVLAAVAARYWPGPLTLVVPASPHLPDEVTAGTGSVALRVPNHPVALALLRLTGPLAVTSANLSGQPSPVTANEVLAQLDDRIDAVLDGGRSPGGVASTVLDLASSPPCILRSGPVTRQELLAAMKSATDGNFDIRVAD